MFPEHQLPANLEACGTEERVAMAGCSGLEGVDRPSTQQVLATLQQCRVNVSVRHTASQTASQ